VTMRFLPLLLVLCLVAVAWADSSSSSSSSSEEDDHGHGHGGCGGNRESLGDLAARASARIDTQSFRLERLASKLEKMQKRIKEVEDVDEADHSEGLLNRIKHLEGGECHKDEFTCGRDHECLSDLLVCDDVEDCQNGHDEDEDVCHNRCESGSVFHGHVRWVACRAQPEAEITITITKNVKTDYFKPRVFVSANVKIEYDEGNKHIGHAESHDGFYNFGHSNLVLQPSEGDHLRLDCEFFSEDLADCVIQEQGASTDCAHVRIVREGHH